MKIKEGVTTEKNIGTYFINIKLIDGDSTKEYSVTLQIFEAALICEAGSELICADGSACECVLIPIVEECRDGEISVCQKEQVDGIE